MATDVLEKDVSAAIHEPETDPLKDEKDYRIPDTEAGWAVAMVHHFRESFYRDAIRRARTGFDYYNNQQWPKDVLAEMESLKRPCLTFNEIRPKIDAVIGEERRNREDWIARPTELSDDDEANVRTALLKHVREINDLDVEESRAFEDLLCGGWGGIAASLVQPPTAVEDDPPLLKMCYRRWDELAWDWNARSRDYTDAQWMAVVTLVNPQKLAEMFPAFENVILSEYRMLNDEAEQVIAQPLAGGYIDSEMRAGLSDAQTQRIQAIEFYYRTNRTYKYVTLSKPNGESIERQLPEDNSAVNAVIKTLEEQGVATIRKVSQPAIRGVLVVGRRVLASWWSPFKGTNAFGQPYFPVFVSLASDTNGYVAGLVEPMIPPQDEVNKRWTMTVENYLQQARSGGIYEDGALENESDLKFWGSPGKWLKVRIGSIANTRLKAHTPPPTDSAVMMLYQMAERAMDRVSNINEARMGMKSQETSGIAIRTRALQSALVQVKAFDNFRRMQLIEGRFVNANLQIMFPVRKIMRLTLPNGEREKVVLNDPIISQNGIDRVANSTAGETFDIVMDLTPSNSTFREMQAQNLASLLGQIGPPLKEVPQFLPSYLALLQGLVKMLDGLPNRDKIVQMMEKAIEGLGAPQAPGAPPGAPAGAGGPPGPPMNLPGVGPDNPGGLPINPAALQAAKLARPGVAITAPGMMGGG